MSKLGKRFARRVAILALTLSLVLGVALAVSPAQPASANSGGISASACNYAGSWCFVQWYAYTPANWTVTWYTYRYGYYQTDTRVYWCTGWCSSTKWIESNTRADTVTVSGSGSMVITALYVYW